MCRRGEPVCLPCEGRWVSKANPEGWRARTCPLRVSPLRPLRGQLSLRAKSRRLRGGCATTRRCGGSPARGADRRLPYEGRWVSAANPEG